MNIWVKLNSYFSTSPYIYISSLHDILYVKICMRFPSTQTSNVMRKRLTYMNTLERLLLIQIFHESLTIVGREARLNWSAGIFLLKKK